MWLSTGCLLGTAMVSGALQVNGKEVTESARLPGSLTPTRPAGSALRAC